MGRCGYEVGSEESLPWTVPPSVHSVAVDREKQKEIIVRNGEAREEIAAAGIDRGN